jgi:hypothetical protein
MIITADTLHAALVNWQMAEAFQVEEYLAVIP